MKLKKQVVCVGANHKTAVISIREELFINRDELHKVLPQFSKDHKLEEAYVLSTCNRFELIFVVNEGEEVDALKLFAKLHSVARPDDPDLDLKMLEDSTYTLLQKDAIEHIFSVTAGLDSLVIGETQITGQFKDATEVAKELGTLGPVLGRLAQEALSASKKVRTHTEIGRKPVSIGHTAIDLANRVYGQISDHKLMILGAGEMARMASQYAVKYKPRGLCIINRTKSKAEDLVAEVGMGEAFDLTQMDAVLQISDIVVSSTAKEDCILTYDIISRAQKARQHRPLFLIDIALPRDIEPSCTDIDNVFLFDIDDLKQIVAEHIEERQLAAEMARGMVLDSTLHFMKWLESFNLKPALSGFREYLDDLIDRESQKTLNKSIFKDLTDSQKNGIISLLHSVAGKISSDAGSNLHRPPEGFYKDQLASALSALFPKPKN